MGQPDQAVKAGTMLPFDVIDSDTHVDQNDETWSYIDDLAAHRPVHGRFDDPQCVRDYWLVAGTKQHKAKRSDVVTKTTASTRELIDVPARLALWTSSGWPSRSSVPPCSSTTGRTIPKWSWR
jgi:hypothetical protein